MALPRQLLGYHARSTGVTCSGGSKYLRPMLTSSSKGTVGNQIACGCLKRMEFICTIISILNIASNLSGNQGNNNFQGR